MPSSVIDLRDELSEEISTILDGNFSVEVTKTNSVPHYGDPAITFPNLDARNLKTKLIETSVLYIDIRRSTELNLQHKPHTVSKLYSAFVRAMTRCAQRNDGHVRGIIGDRVMCLFDQGNAFVNAVETAISMNTVAKYVLNKHFKQNEVTCGIGIDYGRMLVTKTGFRRHGNEQQNYRSLVWLGRPANVASKLTDLANKSGEWRERSVAHVGQEPTGLLGLGAAALSGNAFAGLSPSSSLAPNWNWREMDLKTFVEGFEKDYATGQWKHKLPNLKAFFVQEQKQQVRPSTPPILMTKAVYDGYEQAHPAAKSIVNGWYKEYALKVPGYSGKIYGGDVHWTAFK